MGNRAARLRSRCGSRRRCPQRARAVARRDCPSGGGEVGRRAAITARSRTTPPRGCPLSHGHGTVPSLLRPSMEKRWPNSALLLTVTQSRLGAPSVPAAERHRSAVSLRVLAASPLLGPQNAHKWRAPRRARRLCLSTPKRSAIGATPPCSITKTALADLFSAQCSAFSCGLRGRPEGPTDKPSAATRLLGGLRTLRSLPLRAQPDSLAHLCRGRRPTAGLH